MSNSMRWRKFITWWNDLSTSNMDRVDLEDAIDKKIREIMEDAKSKFGKDNNPNYHANTCSSCSPITEKPCHICGVHVSFGKDNNEFGHSGDKTVSSYPEDSQQPPKERKVSLEEIRQTIRQHGGWESSIDDISKAILSLINATEERKGE